MAVSQIQLTQSMGRMESYLRMLVLPQLEALKPLGIGESEPIGKEYKELRGIMGHYINVKQHFDVVPADRLAAGMVSQHLIVKEDGVVILDKPGCTFDLTTGVETEPLPTYWAEVGKAITHSVTYADAAGVETTAFTQDTVQEDNFTSPVLGPVNIGVSEQIGEVDSPTRPTT